MKPHATDHQHDSPSSDFRSLQTYKEHEIKAFWEYLTETGTKVAPLGMFGPLPDSNEAVRLEWDGKAAHISQSAAFVIVQQKHHPRQKLS